MLPRFSAQAAPWKYLILWLRYYYAIHFLKSGINYVFFGVIPDFSKAGAVGPYLAEMNNIGFYPFIKYLEIVLGSMLLFNLFVPLALAIMASIAFQIAYLNLFISPHPRQLFTGTQEVLLCGLLLLAYGKSYCGLFVRKASTAFPWNNLAPSQTDRPGNNMTSNHPGNAIPVKAGDFLIVMAVALAWMLIVMAFSSTMGTRPLRIYDWGPPVFACLLALACMVKDKQGQSAQHLPTPQP